MAVAWVAEAGPGEPGNDIPGEGASFPRKWGMKMRKKILIIVSFMVLYSASPGFAQRGEVYGRRNLPVSPSPCWTKTSLEATPEQLRALDKLQKSFYQEISALRNQEITIRYELRALLDNPEPDAKRVLAKQNDFSNTQKKIDELSIRYFLKARALFRPEQTSQLPSGCNLGFNSGSGTDGGRGWGQGRGWGRR